MEVGENAGILGQLRPPRLEDAGLEDCALPPDAIREAFFKAADAVRSRAASILSTENDDDDGDCVKDPGPAGGESIDALIGLSPVSDPHQRPCSGEKCAGGLPEVLGDEVAADVTEAEEKVDKVFGGTEVEEGGKSCVDGLQGLEIEEKSEDLPKKAEDDEEDEEKEERPILVEGVV